MKEGIRTSVPSIGKPFRTALPALPSWVAGSASGAIPSLAAIGTRMNDRSRPASSRLQLQRSATSDIIQSVRKLLGIDVDPLIARPMRDADRWSDQAEVAFYEERLAGRP
jgi:hypothetical protein